jgi:peptidoglycan biosynthesis protein MviN/MurJ (putative lipid II flippase)
MLKKSFAKEALISPSYRNSALLSVIFNALGKGVYFLSILLIGRVLGASNETDVYFFTLSLITVCVGFSTLINTDVLIPRIINLRNSEEDKVQAVLSFFYTLYTTMGILLTLIVILFPQFFLDFFSKFKTEVITSDYRIFSLLFPILLLNILTGLQSSILIGYNFFVTPPLITFTANCLSLGLFFILKNSFGIHAAIMGLFLGGIFANLALAFYLIKLCKIKIKPTFKIDLSIFQSLEWVTLLFVTSSIYNLGLNYLLTTTHEEGTLTAFNNAQLIAFIPYQFIAIQLGTIMSNKFAEYYNTNQFDSLKKYIKLTLVIMTIIVLPICLLIIFFSGTIAQLVANKNINDQIYIDRLKLLIICFSLPAYMNAIYYCAIRLYTSTLKVKLTSIVQSIVCLFLLVTDYIGMKYFHFKGLYIANIVSYSFMFLISLVMIWRFYRMIDKKQIAYNLRRTTDTENNNTPSVLGHKIG